MNQTAQEQEPINAEFTIVEESAALVPVPIAMSRIRPALAEETSFVIVKAGELARIYPLPVPAQATIDRLQPLLDEATALEITTADDVTKARAMGKEANEQIKAISDGCYKSVKQFIDSVKGVVLDKEKEYLKKPMLAKTILAKRMTEWDAKERTRIAEEQRIQAQEEERRRQVVLTNARKKLEALMATYTDDKVALEELQEALETPGVTDDEAELIRGQIRIIETKITTTVERSQVVEQRVEEVSQPITPTVNVAQVKTATGVSQEKVIVGINLKVFLRWLVSDACTVDPASVVKLQDGPMKSLVQKMNMPGVTTTYRAKTRF